MVLFASTNLFNLSSLIEKFTISKNQHAQHFIDDTTKMILPTIVLALLITTSSPVQPLRILGLFPHPGLSHFHFFHPIMRALADAGHDVVVVSHFPDKNSPDNYEDLRLPITDMLTNSVDLEVKNSFENYFDLFFHISLPIMLGICTSIATAIFFGNV